MSRNYQRLDLTGFGKLLFTSGDLDPVYLSINRLRLPPDQLGRWLVAYFCFYSSGFASYASERRGKAYWDLLAQAAENTTVTPYGERWPRGVERRHFRGAPAVKAVGVLRKRYGNAPEGMVDYLSDGPMDVKAVIERACTHPMFGGWIGFKVADMLDAVVGAKVDQSDVSVFLYDTPHKSILVNLEAGVIPAPNRKKDQDAPLEYAMRWLQRQLKDYRIPHKPKEGPDWFALETVWCKHLSHMHGHYPIHNDIREIRHGIGPWIRHSATARKFFLGMPKLPEEFSLWNLT